MEREAKQESVAAGKARSGPASRGKPLVQSQEEAVAFGQRFWSQKDSEGKPLDGGEFFKPEKMYSLISQGSNGSPTPVRLLRLSWLLKQARRRAVLSCRQDLEGSSAGGVPVGGRGEQAPARARGRRL